MNTALTFHDTFVYYSAPITFNARTIEFQGKKRGPSTKCAFLNRRIPITLPNGTKTWFVLWAEKYCPTFHAHLTTLQQAEKEARTRHFGILRGETPLDVREHRVVQDEMGNLEVRQVFWWGGCIQLDEREVVRRRPIPRKNEDIREIPLPLREFVEERRELCRSITEACFHPDRVARMEAVYGQDWDDAHHTHTSIGTGETKPYCRRCGSLTCPLPSLREAGTPRSPSRNSWGSS